MVGGLDGAYFGGFEAGEISIVKSTLCGGRGWTSREIGVTGSLTPNFKEDSLTVVAALGDVQPVARGSETVLAWHEGLQ